MRFETESEKEEWYEGVISSYNGLTSKPVTERLKMHHLLMRTWNKLAILSIITTNTLNFLLIFLMYTGFN